MTPDLSAASVEDLLRRYAAILAELKRRGVVRTGNAPLGDYAEGLVAAAYDGELQPNSNKSYDVLTAGGKRLQVKARLLGEDDDVRGKMTMFRSFDFDAAVVLAFDPATYALAWAREIAPDELRGHASYNSHSNAHRLSLRKMRTLGADVTSEFRSAEPRGIPSGRARPTPTTADHSGPRTTANSA